MVELKRVALFFSVGSDFGRKLCESIYAYCAPRANWTFNLSSHRSKAAIARVPRGLDGIITDAVEQSFTDRLAACGLPCVNVSFSPTPLPMVRSDERLVGRVGATAGSSGPTSGHPGTGICWMSFGNEGERGPKRHDVTAEENEMPREISTIDELREYLGIVTENAGHHARAVQRVLLALAGAVVLFKDRGTPIEVFQREGEMKNTSWVRICGQRYALSYNHDGHVEVRQRTTQGAIVARFADTTPIADVVAAFERLTAHQGE